MKWNIVLDVESIVMIYYIGPIIVEKNECTLRNMTNLSSLLRLGIFVFQINNRYDMMM